MWPIFLWRINAKDEFGEIQISMKSSVYFSVWENWEYISSLCKVVNLTVSVMLDSFEHPPRRLKGLELKGSMVENISVMWYKGY